MGIVIALIVAVLLSVTVFMVGCGKTPPTIQPPSPEHAQFRERLNELAQSEPPKDLSMGAMCYDVASPPERFDYVCPVCNAKTVLVNERRYSRTPWELDACRRLVKEIKGLDVALVETGFCQTCFPHAERRSIDLVVHHPNGSSHCVQGITGNDLKLLAEFLAGQEKHMGARGQETPLRDYADRLRELLVLPEDTK